MAGMCLSSSALLANSVALQSLCLTAYPPLPQPATGRLLHAEQDVQRADGAGLRDEEGRVYIDRRVAVQRSAFSSSYLAPTQLHGTGLRIAMLPCMSCSHAPQAAPCCCPCLLCRDPKHFGVILNCLPCGGAADAAAKLLPVTRAEQRALLLEAQYYGETCSRQCGCLHSG